MKRCSHGLLVHVKNLATVGIAAKVSKAASVCRCKFTYSLGLQANLASIPCLERRLLETNRKQQMSAATSAAEVPCTKLSSAGLLTVQRCKHQPQPFPGSHVAVGVHLKACLRIRGENKA